MLRASRRARRRCPTSATRSPPSAINGLARVLRGYSQAGLENVALWHERDISHSGVERVILPDATITLDYMQHLATRLVEGMTVHADRMLANLDLTHGALFSQRALTALIESGMTRDDSYRLVQQAAQTAWDTGTPFRDLLADAGRRIWTSTPSSIPTPTSCTYPRSWPASTHSATEALSSPEPDARPVRGRESDVAPGRTFEPVVAAVNLRERRIVSIATRISSWAKAAPIQRRVPPPNGTQAKVSGALSPMKRSGMKANGSS